MVVLSLECINHKQQYQNWGCHSNVAEYSHLLDCDNFVGTTHPVKQHHILSRLEPFKQYV